MAHDGEVNRARVMPQNPFMIGTVMIHFLSTHSYSTFD